MNGVADAIEDVLAPRRAAVERALDSSLERLDAPGPLGESMRHALLGGGKRLRPVLVLLACEAAGGRLEDALAPAVALEMIHAFSLVHDDLPALDNDILRRGLPTVHAKFGEATAILAGDALLAGAFQHVAAGNPPSPAAASAVAELARAASRMILGQAMDLAAERVPPENVETIEAIYREKTGALFRAACRVGAIAADAPASVLNALDAYGEAVGLMYQIIDDLLDATGSTEAIGKTAGKDAARGKTTYPALVGPEACRARIEELLNAARTSLRPLGSAGSDLLRLSDVLAKRTH